MTIAADHPSAPPEDHPLARFVRDAAHGRFPAVDGAVEVVPPYRDGVEAVVCFTGHAVVATSVDAAALRAWGADGFGGAVLPGPLLGLRGEHGALDVEDVLFTALGTGAPGTSPDDEPPADDPLLDVHPRVVHARRWRDDVHVLGTPDALVILARGLGGLREVSYEVAPSARGAGIGRRLLERALGLVPAGEVLVAAAAPGNAASVRAILAAGFAPIGSVQLVRPGR